MFRVIVATTLATLCSACATHITPAPKLADTPIEAKGIRLVNDSPIGEPRVYFGDGITTYKTDYRGWTQVVINAYSTQLMGKPQATSTGRSLFFSIQGINCSGHYIADCSLSLLVSSSDGAKKVFSTEKYNGYPISSALQKALDAAVALATADPELANFVK